MKYVSGRTSVLVALCLLACPLVPATAGAQTTALYVDSQAGDPIGEGQERTWTTADLTFRASGSASRRQVSIDADTPNFSTLWSLDFAAPLGMQLTPGVYE
ncbi:MAG: hypothetical protein H0W08_27415, partial [Acidobacteria bacterium]|nr:hypothetical protein [Acidobacteriota bacterium]